MYDDGELGGGEGLPLPEQADMILVTYENEDGDLDWKQAEIAEYTNLDIGSDLNILVKYGTYRVTTKRVDRIDNVPVQTAGMLEVRVTGSIIYQTYRTIKNDVYIRSSEDVGASWTDWAKYLFKAVEKVEEMPTTFEDKVYVVDAEGTVTKLGYPLKTKI